MRQLLTIVLSLWLTVNAQVTLSCYNTSTTMGGLDSGSLTSDLVTLNSVLSTLSNSHRAYAFKACTDSADDSLQGFQVAVAD